MNQSTFKHSSADSSAALGTSGHSPLCLRSQKLGKTWDHSKKKVREKVEVRIGFGNIYCN